MPCPVIGCRVRFHDSRGVVKYYGRVGSFDGKWIGIDWDDEERGKHNGSHQNVRYFSTRSPRSGSFMRPESVEYGCGFLDAVQQRYDCSMGEKRGLAVDERAYRSFSSVDLQLALRRVDKLMLDCSRVSHAGSLENLANAFVNVVQLDLSYTLVSEWSAVMDIIRLMPKLVSLNVSNNRMGPPDCLADVRLENIRTLVLCRIGYSWKETSAVCSAFPCLRELWLSCNNVDTLKPFRSDQLALLEELCLDENPMQCWHEVVATIGSLTRLQTLSMKGTGIVEISIADDSLFPSVESLSLSDNNISQWSSINDLNKLTSLQTLYFKRNPVCSLLPEKDVWQMLIAKIKRLRVLNGTMISREERRGAEIDYLKRFAADWYRLKDSEADHEAWAQFYADHPRYTELISAYDEPDRPVKLGQQFKDTLLTVDIIVNGREAIQRKVPGTITAEKLKYLIGKLCRLNANRIKLSYRSSIKPDVVVELYPESQSLHYFSMVDGDTVIVSTV